MSKKLESLIMERGYKNSPVFLELIRIIKNQEKRIKKLEDENVRFQTHS